MGWDDKGYILTFLTKILLMSMLFGAAYLLWLVPYPTGVRVLLVGLIVDI